MRAVRIDDHGGPDILAEAEVATPEPGHGEVLVRTVAASVNPIDTYVREGAAEPADGLPHVVGSDVAGVVVAAGAGVDEFAPGDRAFATGLGLFEQGSYAEYVPVPADRLAHLPEAVPFRTGAAAAMVYPTAWRALVDRGGLTVGDACLIQGGAGGVGNAAVQIARHAGTEVVATARPDDAELVEDAGADAVVDYRADDMAGAVRAAGVDAVDVVLETHADRNLAGDLDLLSRGGRVVVIGEEAPIELSPSLSMDAKIADADLRFMSIVASAEDQKRLLERTAPRLADGTFDVRVADVYPFPEAAEAHRAVESTGTGGKVLLEP
ncbi:NADPH:quinone reductase [Halorarum halophilum]|uniref:NADPH:quinone reductase n=2 Tax=Halorarum halophilum TaxID=2743090 RepID=A0A7D5K384_9EURY|nr:NADPH:quinone reductase [Halobaculum halophilum]